MSLFVDLEKRIGDFHLRVTFETESGVLGLLGSSGCGKSMTLRCIAGLTKPDKGRIVLNGKTLFDSAKHVNLPPQKRQIGYLLQQGALFPNMTVKQNLQAVLRKQKKSERSKWIGEMLQACRIEELRDRRPAELSVGQQQRVALARTLLTRPELLLLDEPFTALDDTVRWQLELDLLNRLQAYPGDVLFVSHSRDEICRICKDVCVLTAGQSEPLISVSTLMHAPGTLSAAELSGCKNFSRAVPADSGVFCRDWGVVLRSGRRPEPDETWIGLRAHSLRLSGPGDPIPCRIDRVIDNVFSDILMLRTETGAGLRMELAKDAWDPLPPGTPITVYAPPEALLYLRETMPRGRKEA